MDPANAAAVMAALEDFGFGSLGLTAADFQQPDTVIQLGYPPQRIDLLTTPDGVEFEHCSAHRTIVEVGSLRVPVIGLDDLIANKLAAARDQDLVDVTALRRLLLRRLGTRKHPDTRLS
jgi:hypothetical protein